MKESRVNFGLAILLIAVTTFGLWLLRDHLSLANISLVYLLVVLVIAVRLETSASVLAAVLSFACFNYFLIQPLYTFFVHDPRDLLDLLVYFAVALVTSQLAARARAEAKSARARADEQRILFKLTSAFNQLTTTEGVYNALAKTLREDLHAVHSQVLPDTNPVPVPDGTVFYLLLRAGDAVYGTLRASFAGPPTLVEIRLLETCAQQSAMALHRIDLMERARKSRTYEEADRLKTALLHAVSHDLRTPITIIKTSAHSLRTLREALPQAEQVEMLETVEEEADTLDQMVGNLLDLSRLRAGALQLNISLNNLEEVAGDVAARAFQRSGQERMKIIFPDDLPLVPFDYGLVLQALTNLVDNALRYEPAGSQIEIHGSLYDGEARVAVVNHGPSISPKERELIMEPFHPGRDGHIGLGLPIAKGIIEAHHGQLWIDDTPGGGATFIFSLPQGERHESTGG